MKHDDDNMIHMYIYHPSNRIRPKDFLFLFYIKYLAVKNMFNLHTLEVTSST